MEKINVAELLKDCPKGMELDCACADNVVFDKIIEYEQIKCVIGECRESLILDKYGRLLHICCPKCVIFPKGKTTWEGFHRPFKDGDIVATSKGDCVFMLKKVISYGSNNIYDGRCYFGVGLKTRTFLAQEDNWYFSRFATKEEKQELFDAVMDYGYNWNEETKTLEKLTEPKFKVGDTVKNKDNHTIVIVRVTDGYYTYINQKGERGILYIRAQNDWELVPDNLIPFESKVLVRGADGDLWKPAIYGFFSHKGIYVVGGIHWTQCIPYEGNEHLLGTTNDCDEYYKTWEEKA